MIESCPTFRQTIPDWHFREPTLMAMKAWSRATPCCILQRVSPPETWYSCAIQQTRHSSHKTVFPRGAVILKLALTWTLRFHRMTNDGVDGCWDSFRTLNRSGRFRRSRWIQSTIRTILYPYIPVLSQRLVRILDAWTVDMNADHYKQKTLKSQKWC